MRSTFKNDEEQPDVTEEVPYELYDAKLAGEFLNVAEETIKWIGTRLK